MSLFDDPFYSSNRKSRSGKGNRKQLIGILLLSVGFGLLLTFLAFPYLVKKGYVDIDTTEQRSEKISAIANQLQPAIVSIYGYEDESDSELSELEAYSIGSGVVIRKTGDSVQIVTNAHVLDQAKHIEAMLYTGERFDAKLIAKDEMSDLAIIEVKSKLLTEVARFGDSDRLKVGETAIAIGNPLGLGNTPSVTTGVISSTKRTVPVTLLGGNGYDWEMDVIQTDAAVNEGNSGGALLNLRGELVGIISMKMHDIGVEGLAFAIPINQARPIIEQMIRDKKVSRPFIGIEMLDLQESANIDSLKLPESVTGGVVVVGVDGPAKSAGLQEDDVIVAIDGVEVADGIDLRKYLYAEKRIGDRLKITFYRDGKKDSLSLRLTEMKQK